MNPGPVREAGRDLDQLADDTRESIAARFRSSDAAAKGNNGWKSATSLRGCGRAWSDQLALLVQQTSQTSQDLTSSAAAVSGADTEAASRLDRVLNDLAG